MAKVKSCAVSTVVREPPATRILSTDNDGHHSTDLFRRYERLFIGASVVRGILELERLLSLDPIAARAGFARQRHVWESRGGYLETITAADIRAWIDSDACVVAEASAPDATMDGRFVPVAQAIYRCPTGDWVVPLLDASEDVVCNPSLHEDIVEHGAGATALVDYLGVLPEWSNQKLAGAARYAGMLEVVRRNATRPEPDRIRHAIGASFAIQGVEVVEPREHESDGRLVRLADLGEREIVNGASVRAITTSRLCPAHMVGTWRSASPVAVTVQG